MIWRRAATIGIAGVAVLAAGGYFGLQTMKREARAVDDGVVEFKKGNYESAVRMLTPYADNGNKAAELNVGIAYAFGLGVSRSRERAHALFRHSLGSKSQDTCMWVAKSFETGDGVAKDMEEAIAWYRIAAEDGSIEAREHLKGIGRRSQPAGPRPAGRQISEGAFCNTLNSIKHLSCASDSLARHTLCDVLAVQLLGESKSGWRSCVPG